MGGWRVPVAIVAGLTLVAVWIWVSSRGGDIPPAAPAADRDAEIEALRSALEAESERSRELAAQVEWLRLQLEELARSEAAQPGGGDTTPPDAERETPAGEQKPDEKLWFDVGLLLANGVPSHEVERLREIFDASEMEIIDLRHQATREGWLRSGRYAREMHDLRAGLRQEIGDESFDLLLYATGRKNRVLITDVLGASPSERAGFQPGDIVLSYDGKRIFKTTELQRATTQGRLGDGVVVEVLRDGEVIRLYPARGPLGTRLKPTRKMPQTRW
jgi:membrane-associated protease RseP (regulator of RpoE activity)